VQTLPTLLTTGHAAHDLGYSSEHTRRLALAGRLPAAARTTTGQYLFDAEDVARFRESRLPRRQRLAVDGPPAA
jgi:hypothetical protein